jgi:hypothetical protein
MACYRTLLVLFLVLAVVGCGGDSGTTPTPTTTTTSVPAGPSAANITLTIIGAGALGSGQGNLVQFQIRLQESAGLGANINFIRVDVYRATGQFEERQEIGSGQIVNQTGTNRLNANETRNMTVTIGFNATIKSGRIIRFTVGMTDDRGNNQDKVQDFVFS